MPKMKTKKAAAKRITVTKTGKLKRRRAFRSHNFGNKSQKRKRLFAKTFDVAKSDEDRMKRLLGVK